MEFGGAVRVMMYPVQSYETAIKDSYVAIRMIMPESGTINGIVFWQATNTGTVTNIGSVCICAEDANGFPDLTNIISGWQTFTPAGGYAENNVTFSSAGSAKAGQPIWQIFRNISGTPLSNYWTLRNGIYDTAGVQPSLYSADGGSTWTNAGGGWNPWNIKINGYWYGRKYGRYINNNVTYNRLYRTDSVTVRAGVMFRVPCPCVPDSAIAGLFRVGTTDVDVVLELYDGATLIATSTKFNVAAASTNTSTWTAYNVVFDTDKILIPNKTYRLVYKCLSNVGDGTSVYLGMRGLQIISGTYLPSNDRCWDTVIGHCFATAPTISSMSDWTDYTGADQTWAMIGFTAQNCGRVVSND